MERHELAAGLCPRGLQVSRAEKPRQRIGRRIGKGA